MNSTQSALTKTLVIHDDIEGGKVCPISTAKTRQLHIMRVLADIASKSPDRLEIQRNVTPAPVCLLQLIHSPAYVSCIGNAYASAKTSGDTDWFKNEELKPYHFALHQRELGPNPRLLLHKHIGYYCNDDITPITASTWSNASGSASNSIFGALSILDGGYRQVYAANSSPGHHAYGVGYGGYCFFNNAAIAANYLWTAKKERVTILDLDYHAGDGTQSIFYRDPNILTISIHMDPRYDYPSYSGFEEERGVGEGLGANFNILMKPGCTWLDYQKHLVRAREVIDKHGSAYLVVAFGADTLEGDPDPSNIAGTKLQVSDYVTMGNMLRSWDMPMLITQEGGYSQDKVPTVVRNLLGL